MRTNEEILAAYRAATPSDQAQAEAILFPADDWMNGAGSNLAMDFLSHQATSGVPRTGR